MANLAESAEWPEGVYQLETTDPVQGGEGGIANLQAQQLANRSKVMRRCIPYAIGLFKLINGAPVLHHGGGWHDTLAISEYAGGAGQYQFRLKDSVNIAYDGLVITQVVANWPGSFAGVQAVECNRGIGPFFVLHLMKPAADGGMEEVGAYPLEADNVWLSVVVWSASRSEGLLPLPA